ncbi:CDP-diacylglycerol--glycerol-3-phosphate 3-phosphatidyltransferase [Methylomagnum ishizawai]|uniref:CDP-diacylglycerol--glycerol-3-phosphate 3-phosphatidyltransferase n=1 Tax=Methylomagnum ishizawai TaxID=1760988 RepID=A0A1Y6D6A2_9GAMM|nr:CDP-alcohol phosphatidyltransferase family protein [Methylomagnum ishizawai]SMF95445.1 CDP-diacylglycerol--glycerol-3-phosphate 3-phosphatidyltransferase [Methylomagnum ishizawai]
MNPKHLPNLISVARILLVYPVVSLLLQQRFGAALALFVVAGLSDGVDGFLAKHYHWQSRLGSYLDPLADKLLLISSYVALGWLGLMPVWLVGLVVLRDLVIFGGAVAYYFMLRPFEGQPTLLSKLNTVLQLVLVFAVIVRQGIAPFPAAVAEALLWLTAFTTLASGAHYVQVWGSSYWREKQRQGPDAA